MAGGSKRPRSWEVTEGPAARARPRDAPRGRVLRGRLRQAAGRRRLVAGTRSPPATTTSTSSPRSRRRASRQGGAVPIEFTTIAVTDGIAMGHEGMKASLMSRDLIADSVELVMHAERMDALVGIAGCDKSEPGMLMAMARMNLPSRLPLRRHDPAGHLRGPRHHDPGRVRGRRARTRRARSTTRSCSRIERAACPGTGLVRRDVHGEHDGRRRRGDRHVAARARRRRPRSTTGARSLARESGIARRAARRRRRAAPARHHDEGGLRERDRRRDGARRLDERGAAPARDRARGARRPAARRLRPDRAATCRTSSTSARRAGS